jgi:hypothetical protein
MAILKNVELFFAKLDENKPNARFDANNPTWEVQIRTRDKKQAKEWKDLNVNVKTDDDDNGVFYKATLKKKTKKANGEPQNPVNLVGGGLAPIDPNTLGNGSIGNVRIYQYNYEVGGRKGIASMLMAVQVTTLKEYTPKPREDDFEMTEMEVIKVADNQSVDEDQFASKDELEDLDF